MSPSLFINSKNMVVLGQTASFFLWICCYIFPSLAGVPYVIPFDGRLQIFPLPMLTILWLSCCLIIPVGTGLILLRRTRDEFLFVDNHPLLFIFSPLLVLPLTAFVQSFRLQINQQFVANLLFYIPAVIFSAILYRGIRYYLQSDGTRAITNRLILAVGIFFFVFYWITGWYFTVICGEHTGDEGHYIIQAESLYFDHDLDLKNNFDANELRYIERGQEKYLHISPNTVEGKYHSWHPFGLPLYIALLPIDNFIYRHLLLGLLSGLGSAGLLLLCRIFTVSRQAALPLLFLFCLSPLWGIYSARVLPELPGAALAIWTAIAVLTAIQRPWFSGLLIIICCGSLPFFHQRFAPISLFGYLFFIFSFHESRQLLKSWRVILFTTSGLALLAGIFLYVNAQLYTTAVGYSTNLFDFYLAGMWEVIASNRGIIYIQPSFAWMLTVSLLFLFSPGEKRKYVLFSLLAFSGVLFISCSNTGWYGGSSTYGRYLVAVYPLFFPLAAYVYERSNPTARWWLLLLSVIPVLHFLLLLLNLPQFDGNFGDPRYYIGSVYEYLTGLLNPFPEPETPVSMFFARDGYLFPILLFILTFMLILPRKNSTFLLGYPILMIAAAIYCHNADNSPGWSSLDERGIFLTRKFNAGQWAKYDLEKAFIASKPPQQSFALPAASNLFSLHTNSRLSSVTTDEKLKNNDLNIIFQPEMKPNDWEGRAIFWTTLGSRFQAGPNDSLFSLSGELTGNAEAQLLVMEMGGERSHLLLDKTLVSGSEPRALQEKYILQPTGDGLVHILIRITSGTGTFISKDLGWSPFSQQLLEKSRSYIPQDYVYPEQNR